MLTCSLLFSCGGGGDEEAPSAEPSAPSFETVYEEVFVPGLCGDSICHGEQMQGGGLDLRDAVVAFESLVEMPATGPLCRTSPLLRVTPFRPEESLLYLKLHRDSSPCGDVMPPTAIVLSEAQIALIYTWVEAGARFSDSSN